MRQDKDMLGTVDLPDESYYGVHTVRAVANFAVSDVYIADMPYYVPSIALVKKAAALANADIGVLSPHVARAIREAADEVVAGSFDRSQFPVDVLAGGGGVSANMVVNEVIASRANELISGRKDYLHVHPNNHVNAGQSTSDALATATSLALHASLVDLIGEVRALEAVLEAKIARYRSTVKLSRTCLQDAVPVTFAQQFGAYLASVRRGRLRLEAAADACLDVPMGATVVGTGLGLGRGYLDRIYPRLREVTGLPLRRHPDFFDCFQNGDTYLTVSAALKALATGLAKMGRDLRLLASGPLTGLREITLPAVQAGSSFMPGKVNPVMPELIVQISYQVGGNDAAISMAVEGAELDFNAWTGLIAKNLFDSCRLLTRAIPLFTDRCLSGMEVDEELCRSTAEGTLALSAVVGGVYGYEAGSRAAAHAARTGGTIRQAVVDLGIASPADAAALLSLDVLTDGERSAAVLDSLLAKARGTVADLVRAIPEPVRHGVLDAATIIVHADDVVTAAERLALETVAAALAVPVPEAVPDRLTVPDGTRHADRRLVYACAAWMVWADQVEDASETAALEDIRTACDLTPDEAAALAAQMSALHRERRRYVPRSEDLPWWEEFGRLLTTITKATATPTPTT
ncbi:lyase family protein [Actinocorallia sp. A-T 12471]|uniref:lyase family protein n=1 Tax=Actinocorallia sp. A-T 12471 TaxID=3089813 RepID=UPI0029D081FD|nr:lyase family protein [Actinocorallia sp. A-T 12471]MDX6740438.1 lyase family protein [Actinocorallia sp. A-T 12471]